MPFSSNRAYFVEYFDPRFIRTSSIIVRNLNPNEEIVNFSFATCDPSSICRIHVCGFLGKRITSDALPSPTDPHLALHRVGQLLCCLVVNFTHKMLPQFWLNDNLFLFLHLFIQLDPRSLRILKNSMISLSKLISFG